MTGIGRVIERGGTATVRVDPGVRLDALREHLAERGWYYPPVPTYEQATIGGTVATNAGGAATFKYGVTRDWVRGLRVVLFNGDVLELERGQAVAERGGRFDIVLDDGARLAVPTPDHRLPPVKKISAGYHAAESLDLVDLFVGSEGTLGLISSITLDLVPLPAAVVTGVVFPESEGGALAVAAELREEALRARAAPAGAGVDVRAIEYVDADGLALLREAGVVSRLRVNVPDSARAALLFEVELDRPTDDAVVESAALAALEGGRGQAGAPLGRLFAVLSRHGVLETLELALPGQGARSRALKELREAVPRRVNELLLARRRDCPEMKKVAGDLIVPFEHVATMLDRYRAGFEARGLEHAVWGHLSDGNLHPNALPRDAAEVRSAAECILEFAEQAIRLGGSPLSEHGVGRDPLKQRLLERFLGPPALERMREVKRALDPPWRLAPGVLFPPV